MTELTDDELLIIWRFNFAKTNKQRFLDIARAAIAADRDLTAALAKPADGPAAVAERPSDEELGLIYHDCCRGCEFMDQVGFEDAARAVLARWGQPPAPLAEGEVAELAEALRGDLAEPWRGLHGETALTRAAELLERHAAPVPAETLAARPLIEQVAAMGDCIGQQTVGQIMSLASRAASWLAENPPGQPVAIEPRGCPTPGACSCLEPAPQGGEVES